MISRENAGMVKIEGKFPSTVCRKDAGSNSILHQFCRYCVHKRYVGIIDILKKDSKFECETCANQQTDIVEDYPGI